MIRALLLAVAAAALLAAPAQAQGTVVLRTVTTTESWAMPNASVRGPSVPPTEDLPTASVPLLYARYGYRLAATLPGQQLRLTGYASCVRADGTSRLVKRSWTFVSARGALARTFWLAAPLPAAEACDVFASVTRFARSARTGKWVPVTRGRMVVTLLAR